MNWLKCMGSHHIEHIQDSITPAFSLRITIKSYIKKTNMKKLKSFFLFFFLIKSFSSLKSVLHIKLNQTNKKRFLGKLFFPPQSVTYYTEPAAQIYCL